MRIIISLFVFFIIIPYTNAQESSVIDTLKAKITRTKSDSSKAIYQKKIGEYYRKFGKIIEAKKYADIALTTSLQSKKPEVIAESYLLLGNISYSKWESSKAIEYYQKVDSILSNEKIVNKTLIKALTNTGQIHNRLVPKLFDSLGYSKGKGYFLKALDLAIKTKDSINQGYLYIRLGHTQRGISGNEDAISYFLKAVPFIPDSSKESVGLYYALGSSYIKVDSTKKAIYYMEKYFKKRKSSNNPKDLAIGHWSYGRHKYELKKYKEAIFHEKKSEELYNQFENLNIGALASVYRTIADSYEKLNDYKNAYDYRALEKKMTDSTLQVSKTRELEELEAKYQTEKKEQEIAVLQAQNKTVEAQKKNQRNLLLGGLALTSITGLFLFLGFRNRKKTNNKLRELDTMKSSFFENISYEFRTPLSLIAGPVEQQLQKPDIDSSEKKNLTIAKRNTNRLLILVDQLLDLSKLEAGHFKLKVQQGNLSVFLKSLTSSFSYLAQENNQAYTVNIDISENTYYFDADALEKIITNLISNALKYRPDGESIEITGSIENQKLQLIVKNTGTSLSEEALQTIFNRFARTDEQTTGTGIGLALSRELATLHKGTISAQSDNTWASFTVTLPVTETAFSTNEKATGVVDTSAFAKANTISLQKQIITEEADIFSKETNPILLIVDDNADLRTYVSSLFENTYTIHTAQDGSEGFEIASSIVPDLIITDLMMPKDDGITLTKNCKTSETTSHIPIVILTAKVGDENRLTGLENGADAYITKPFNTEILKTTTHNLLESRKKLQERFSQEVVLIPKNVAINSVDEHFLDNLKEVVDTQIIESDFTTESFAKALGMSRMQLHRKLKALTGLSATEFIRSQRLKLAAQLLKKSDINVSQVGYAVGFNNHSYFTKCFKEHYGISPSDYAKKS